ncbi:hypothetical protein L0P02_11520 [Bifidobacterium longum]|nr:hypothetical protein [Bifidobacterium longum]
MVIQKSITNDFFNFSNLILQTAKQKSDIGIESDISISTPDIVEPFFESTLLAFYFCLYLRTYFSIALPTPS